MTTRRALIAAIAATPLAFLVGKGTVDSAPDLYPHLRVVQYVPIDALGWKSWGKNWHLAALDYWDEYDPELPFTIDDGEILWVRAIYPDNLWLLTSGSWGWNKPGESVEEVTREFSLKQPIIIL